MGRQSNVANVPMRRLDVSRLFRVVLLVHAYRRAAQHFGLDEGQARADAARAIERALRTTGLIPYQGRYVVFGRRCAWGVSHGLQGAIVVHTALYKSKVRWKLARAAERVRKAPEGRRLTRTG